MKKIINDKNAITLIALVITIVVLIILAAVAINLSLGNNGIFNRAKIGKELYQNSEEYEQDHVESITNRIDSFTRSGTNSGSSYKETILLETPTDSGVVTFKDGHNIDEFDAIEFLFATKSTAVKTDAFTTTEYKTSDWNYIIDNYNAGNTAVIGLYGYGERYIDFNDITKTGFTIREASKHIIIRILGINY